MEVRRGDASQHRFLKTYYSEACRTGYYAGSGRYSVCDGRIG